MFTTVYLVSVLVNSWLKRCKRTMAHLFKQIYVDEVDFRETLAYDQLIGLVFTEFVHRQMEQLEELERDCPVLDKDEGNL